MKRKYKLFVLILSCLFMASKCNDKQETQPYVLTGRMVADCNSTPVAGVDLLLKQELNMFNKGGLLAEVTTDENGYFRFEYVPEWSGKLRINSSGSILEEIPVQKSLDVGDVYFSSTVNFIIKLQVNNSYTENDTLIIPDYNGNNPFGQLSFSGPFSNGILDTVFNYQITTPIRYGAISESYINYFFQPYGELKFQYFQSPICSSTFSQAIITIE